MIEILIFAVLCLIAFSLLRIDMHMDELCTWVFFMYKADHPELMGDEDERRV